MKVLNGAQRCWRVQEDGAGEISVQQWTAGYSRVQQGAAGCSRVQKVAHKDWERGGVRDWAKAGGLGVAAVCRER